MLNLHICWLEEIPDNQYQINRKYSAFEYRNDLKIFLKKKEISVSCEQTMMCK